jgi:pimeloyl-ACP methyl ester carboxylesterase
MPVPLAYRKYGDSGPAVLILHGLFGQSDNWTSVAKTLSEHGFQVYTLDSRNHGLSPHTIEWSYETMADDLSHFIKNHALTNPLCIGHSMGGKTLLYYESLFSGTLRGLIIVDIAARNYPPHHSDVFKALLSVDFNTLKTRKEAELVLQNQIPEPGVRQFLLKNLYWKDAPRQELAWRFNLDVLNHHAHEIGKAVPEFYSNTPAALIYGTHSSYINSEDLADFKKRFTNFTLYPIEHSGHWVHAEQPQAFVKAFIDFTNTLVGY